MTPDEFSEKVSAAHVAAIVEDTERLAAQCVWDRQPRGEHGHWEHRNLTLRNYDTMGYAGDRQYVTDSSFHLRGGVYAERLKCGCVTLSSWLPSRNSGLELVWNREIFATIRPTEWASVVCSVSKGGETTERWQEMLAFHTPEKAAVSPAVLQGEPR